jgi:hypothetical protein
MRKNIKIFVSSSINSIDPKELVKLNHEFLRFKIKHPLVEVVLNPDITDLENIEENEIGVLFLTITEDFGFSRMYDAKKIELEYNYAILNRITVIPIIDNKFLLSQETIKKGRTHLFVESLLNNTIVEFFENLDNLLLKIQRVLYQLISVEKNQTLAGVDNDLSRLVIYVEPGTASPEDIGSLMAEISKLYKMIGGSGISFRPEEVRYPVYEYE